MQQHKKTIVFWQLMVSPHISGLAKAMADRGWVVHYIANEPVSADRLKQGWNIPDLGGAKLHLLNQSTSGLAQLLASLPSDAVHICQGVRSNGYVATVHSWLRKRKRTVYVVMETVDDSGLLGAAKRFIYKLWFAHHKNVTGYLAIGYKTAQWISDRGVPKHKVFEFAYFLPPITQDESGVLDKDGIELHDQKVRIAFIGQIIERKRLNLLISALSKINGTNYVLDVFGAGDLIDSMKDQARSLGVSNVNWHGVLPMSDIHQFLSRVDCLVLPSSHDGWGAVVSEALLSGCRVICSDACGSSGVAVASNAGYVFPSESARCLKNALQNILDSGKVSPNERLLTRKWAKSNISMIPGSAYLDEIVSSTIYSDIEPPWMRIGTQGII